MREMRDAATTIRDLVGDRQAVEIQAESLRRSALLWHFTVLGEAASQVPDGIRDAHPHIAWRAAARLRNRIVHGYWDIDVETLVVTAADDLPEMIDHLESLIADLHRADDPGPSA